MMDEPVTADTVLALLRRLPPRDRLKVIALALPEAESHLLGEDQPLSSDRTQRSLRGLWKDLGFDLSEEDIDRARGEAWACFPREDI